MARQDDPDRDDGYRSSWTQGGATTTRGDAYGQRSGSSAGDAGARASGPETAAAARRPGSEEHFDHEYRRWRDEQARAMDQDYRSWRRERFSSDFAEWRAIRAAQAGLRTGSGPPITHADRERELRGTADDDDRTGRERGR